MKTAALLPPASATRKKLIHQIYASRYLLFMALPAVIYYIMFCYIPMYGIVIGFKDFQMKYGFSILENIANSPWVGLKHIKDYFNSMFFWRNIRNTLLLYFYSLIFGFPLPILFALLLNEMRNEKAKKVVQTISYLPHFISSVAICSMVTMFLSTTGGFVNTFLTKLGVGPIYFLGDARYFRSIYVFTGIWQSLGWNSIIYLAAISTVDIALYEASTIDGANRWQNIWHITLPHLKATIATLLILNTGGVLNQGGEKVILLYSPSTYETADVISSFIYRRGIQENDFAYSTAIGMFTSLINAIMMITTNYISEKLTQSSLF